MTHDPTTIQAFTILPDEGLSFNACTYFIPLNFALQDKGTEMYNRNENELVINYSNPP